MRHPYKHNVELQKMYNIICYYYILLFVQPNTDSDDTFKELVVRLKNACIFNICVYLYNIRCTVYCFYPELRLEWNNKCFHFFLVTWYAGTIILVRRFSFASPKWRVCRNWRDKFVKKNYISLEGISIICLIHNSFPLTQSITQNGMRPWQSHFYCFSLCARACVSASLGKHKTTNAKVKTKTHAQNEVLW